MLCFEYFVISLSLTLSWDLSTFGDTSKFQVISWFKYVHYFLICLTFWSFWKTIYLLLISKCFIKPPRGSSKSLRKGLQIGLRSQKSSTLTWNVWCRMWPFRGLLCHFTFNLKSTVSLMGRLHLPSPPPLPKRKKKHPPQFPYQTNTPTSISKI